MNIKGKIFKLSDNVDTDVIIPAKYLNTSDPKVLALHCLEPLLEQLGKKLEGYNIIVAGKNFGCGSSREHAPVAIKYAGVNCIIAESFARIFFRNAINIGLAVVELPNAKKNFDFDDIVEVDLAKGVVKNLTKKQEIKFLPFPEFLQKIILSGGLINFVKENIKE